MGLKGYSLAVSTQLSFLNQYIGLLLGRFIFYFYLLFVHAVQNIKIKNILKLNCKLHSDVVITSKILSSDHVVLRHSSYVH